MRIDLVAQHLDWSHTQRRILTANGEADLFYTAERGFPFALSELPHYHLQRPQTDVTAPTTRDVFEEWKQEDKQSIPLVSAIVGAWKRPLFYGGWEHTTDRDEHVFNVQTTSLFIDLRIPCTRYHLLSNHHVQSLEDLNTDQLRWYARQHIFAGYSRVAKDSCLVERQTDATRASQALDVCCTRHHCIDWNFVGVPRSRPNKWWIETSPHTNAVWKEWAYATNFQGQHYYCERWERLDAKVLPVLSLRKMSGRDGVIVVVGDHFNYCLDRVVAAPHQAMAQACTSLVEVVDVALEQNNLPAAQAWLSLQGGHGLVSRGWQLDCCIEPWRQGSALWTPNDVSVVGESIDNCTVVWNGQAWSIFECSLTSVDELRNLLHQCVPAANL